MRQIWAFLGLASYYQRFVPNFPSLVAPLSDLTRKDEPEKVCWTEHTKEALRSQKVTLTRKVKIREVETM